MTDEQTQNEQAISADAEMASGEATEREPTEPTGESDIDGEPEPEPEATGEPVGEEAAPRASAKRKRKRLPRALRPQRTRRTRTKPKERKPIVRLPKPEHARGRRQERLGTVVSAAADKTIVVRVDVAKMHPTYKKVIRRSAKLHAHDEHNEAKVGDLVRIVETRPLSRMKRWRLHEIVEAAK
jgi:small subunit ribosomal protein S17